MKKILAILLLLTTSANAGPDKTTGYLIDTPASLMDLGILKMESHIHRLTQGTKFCSASLFPFVEYNFNSNTIAISSTGIAYDLEYARLDCEDWFGRVRFAAGYDDDRKKFIGIARTFSIFAGYFQHSGYVVGRNEVTRLRLEDLDKKIEINYDVFEDVAASAEGNRFHLSCTGKLVDDKVYMTTLLRGN